MTPARLGIITLTSRTWSDQYMTASNIVSRLGRTHPVVWVSPAHHWRALLSRALVRPPGFRQPLRDGKLTVYTPPAHLPRVYRPRCLARWLMARRLKSARTFLEQQGCDRIALYIWRPKYLDALELVEHDVSIYHIVDEYSFSPSDPPTSSEEERLIQSVDHLIVHSPALMEKKGNGRQTVFIPNGVDFDSFANPGEEPRDLAPIPHPRIGYCGYLKRQMDWDLLSSLIDRHQDHSWVFVGKLHHADLEPVISDLDRRPNVFFLGPKSSRELARYPGHFDVTIMPYVKDGYTQYIFPLKLHEYLAAGRPTIGTPIRSLLDFESVVHIADGAEEWSIAIEKALSDGEASGERVAERQSVAREHDWDVLTARISELLLSDSTPPGTSSGL